MGRVDSAFDDALAETFFATLKIELVYRRFWPTRHYLEMEVFSYLECFYNSRRRFSRLGNLSPTDYEQQLVTSPGRAPHGWPAHPPQSATERCGSGSR